MEPDQILQKLPKQTPSWAIGLVSVLVSFALCLGTVYVVVRPEVQVYLTEGYKQQDKKVETDAALTSSILSLVRSNTDQITTLSTALAVTQDENRKLTERVVGLEKLLEGCQKSLKVGK